MTGGASMPEENKFVISNGPARSLVLIAVVIYISAGIYLNTSPAFITLFHRKVHNYLICHTMILIGLSLHFGGLMTSAVYRRRPVMWLMVPLLAFYAWQIASDWLRLLA